MPDAKRKIPPSIWRAENPAAQSVIDRPAFYRDHAPIPGTRGWIEYHHTGDCSKAWDRLKQEHSALLAAARREERAKAEKVLKDAHEHCLCDRFTTKGFDYGEEHRRLGKPRLGSRWLTPRDLIEVFWTQLKAKARTGEGVMETDDAHKVARAVLDAHRRLEDEKGGER